MKPELQIIFKLWDLEREWNKLADPQLNWYGNMTYRRTTDKELFRLVDIQNEQKRLKKELLKQVGLWSYVKYITNPLKFTKKLTWKI